MRSGKGHQREHPCQEHPYALAPAAASLPGMGSKEFSPSRLGRASRVLGPSLPDSPAKPPGRAALPSPAMYLLCLCTYKDTGGTCKVSPMGKPPLVIQGFLRTGSCNASLLSLSILGALAGGCWCHPKQGTRMPRVQPLPPKHTGTTLGF